MKLKHLKRPLALLLTLLLTLSLFPAAASAETDDPVTLTIIHVNDRHGRMDADPYISRLANGITGNVLILDAGDALHGQTAANLSKGEAMVEVMNAVGYSAMVPGNHDFNYGMERLLELSAMMDFPLLAANIRTADGELLFQPYQVFTLDGVTVGVFGLATPETVTASDPRNVSGLVFDDPAQTAEAAVTALKAEGCDIVIALTHMGQDESSEPEDRSDAVAAVSGIDVIIDGHSHDLLENGLLVGDTLIAQTGEHGKNIGVVEFTATGKTARLIEVNDELPADESILAVIDAANAKNEHITAAVVGSAPVLLQGERAQVRTGETNLANLVADSMRWATGAEIAFLTGGNIRASIDAGEITMGQVLTVLPFSNLLVTVELTGAELLGVLEHGVSEYPEEAGKHIQVSGISFSFDPDAKPGVRVHSVKLANGDPLDRSKTYTVATSEFLAFGGDGYDLDGRSLVYYGGDAEALADYLGTEPILIAEPEGRVKASPRFDDVSKDAWYFPAVTNVAAKGLIPSGGPFSPHASVTADEMRGWVKTFVPDNDTSVRGGEPLTREYLAVMLYEMLYDQKFAQTGGEPDYADVELIDGGSLGLTAVTYAYKTGLMIGDGKGFDPKGTVTRAQAAAVLNNVINAYRMGKPSALAEKAFEYFLEISKIPRGSGNMRGISDYLKSFGEDRGLETVQDEILNILIKKPGSAGREKEPPIILQAHMDMVCEKNEGVEHDFLKDPIIPVIDGDWVKANGTTLGADNASGLSIILALLDADGLSHPPIEALITIDEETTTDGAFLFDTTLLKGRRLINLDSEDEGVFTVSSAAAGSAAVAIPVETAAISDGFAAYKLTVKGLTGGHSGVDIDKGLANANILMARLFSELDGIAVSSINGGSAINAIPRECTAVISFAEKDLDAVQWAVAEAQAVFKAEYPQDGGLTVTLEKAETPANVMSGDSLQNILDCVLRIPNGVLVMSPGIEGLVQTSNNLGVIATEGNAVVISCFARSSEPDEQAETLAAIQSLADSLGAKADIENGFPAWPYKADSPLRDTMSEVFKAMYGREASIEAIHAGLECGIFAESMPGCDMISIGPDVRGGHSPDERMSLSSFYRTVDFVVKVLAQI